MIRFKITFWLAWSLTAILGLLLVGSAASGQTAVTPQSNWMQLGPQELLRDNLGKIFPGPILEPGQHMVWVAAKQNDGTLPYNLWRSYGPFEALPGQTYLVTVQGSEIPAVAWKAWNVLDPIQGSLASVHYLNQSADDAALGIMVIPLVGPVPRVAITDALTADDPRDARHQCPHRVYPVALDQGKTYVIEMRSTEFDTYLMLENDCGELLAQNDEDCIVPTNQALNSRVTFQPSATGTYQLVASAFSASGTGNFTITVREVPVIMRVEDRLIPSDAARNDCYCKEYEVTLTASRRYFVDAASSDFGTCVKLLASDGTIVAFDEGGGMDFNTRIAHPALTTGTYRVVVTSFAPRSSGAYTLTIREDE